MPACNHQISPVAHNADYLSPSFHSALWRLSLQTENFYSTYWCDSMRPQSDCLSSQRDNMAFHDTYWERVLDVNFSVIYRRKMSLWQKALTHASTETDRQEEIKLTKHRTQSSTSLYSGRHIYIPFYMQQCDVHIRDKKVTLEREIPLQNTVLLFSCLPDLHSLSICNIFCTQWAQQFLLLLCSANTFKQFRLYVFSDHKNPEPLKNMRKTPKITGLFWCNG